MKYLVIVALAALTLSSCVLEQSFRFNNDYSGRYEMTIDMSAMAGMMGDETEGYTSPLDTMNVDSLEMALNAVEGISNARITDDNGKMVIGYDFTDVETLNGSLQEQNLGDMLGASGAAQRPVLEKKGKKLSYSVPDLTELGKDNEEMQQMQGMGEMFQYRIVMSFANQVKSVNNKDATISIDKKSVTYESNLSSLLSGDSKPNMLVKLK